MSVDYNSSWEEPYTNGEGVSKGTTTRFPVCTHMLVAFDLIWLVGSAVMTLNAPPGIPSQERCLAFGFIAVNRLPQTTVLTRHDEIPNVGFAN